MKLKEIFDALTYGELSQVNIGGGEDGAISEANYPRILSSINLGLGALYRRFLVKESTVMIALQNEQTTYQLHSDYAVANRRSRETKYLVDSTAHPFKDDVAKIERVYTDDKYELLLNDRSNEESLFTPTMTTLVIPEIMVSVDLDTPDHLKTTHLKVAYRAEHVPIVIPIGFFDPARVDVELPYAYLNPLLYFVASRVHNPIGMVNEFNAGNNWNAKYEQACAMLEQQNIKVDQGSQNTGIQRNGWV